MVSDRIDRAPLAEGIHWQQAAVYEDAQSLRRHMPDVCHEDVDPVACGVAC